MLAASLEVNLYGNTSSFKADFKSARDVSAAATADIASGATMAAGKIDGLSAASREHVKAMQQIASTAEVVAVKEQALAGAMVKDMGRTQSALSAASVAAEKTAKSFAKLDVGPAKINFGEDVGAQFNEEINKIDTESWQAKFGAGMWKSLTADIELVKGALNEAGEVAEGTAESFSHLQIGPAQLTVSNDTVEQFNAQMAKIDTDSWQAQIGSAVGASMREGIELAQSAYEKFQEWVKAKIVITGVALATGVAAAALTALYTAYKVADFAIGLLTGESYKSKSIDATIAQIKAVNDLKDSLEITANQADSTREALDALGVDRGDYSAVYTKASAAIANNEEELERLGLEVGTVDELIQSANATLYSYTEGFERNQMAAAIGLGSAKQVAEAAKISEAALGMAAKTLNDYNLAIGTDTVIAAQRYKDTVHEFNHNSDLMGQGFHRAWSDQIQPVLTDLAEYFKDGMPIVVNSFRYSMATITALFYGLKTVAYAASEAIVGSISAISTVLGSVIDGFSTGNWGKHWEAGWEAAKNTMVAGWESAKERIGQIGENIVSQSRHNASAMKMAWALDDRREGIDVPQGREFESNAELIAQKKRETAATKEALDARLKYFDQQFAGVDKTREDVAAQKEAIAAMGYSSAQLAQLSAAKMRDQAASKERAAQMALDKNGDEYAYTLLKRQAGELRELASLKLQASSRQEGFEASRKAQEEYESLIKSIKDKIRAQEIDMEGSAQYSEAQKLSAKLMLDLRDGVLKLNQEQAILLATKLNLLLANDKELAANKRELDANKAAQDAQLKHLQLQDAEEAKLKESVKQQLEANAAIGLTVQALADLQAAKLRDQALTLDLLALKALDKNADELAYDTYKRQAAELRKLADLRQEMPGLQAAYESEKKAADESSQHWKETAKEIEKSISGAIMSGFTGSNSFIKDFIASLKGMFAKLVLQPMLAPISASLASLIVPTAPQANEAGKAGEATSLLQTGSGLFDMLGNGVSAFGDKVGNATQMMINKAQGYSYSAGVSTVGQFAQFANTASQIAASLYMGKQLGTAISGGFSIGNHGSAIVNLGTALFGPIGGAVGGFLNRAFGMGQKSETSRTLTGNLSASGLANGMTNVGWHQDGGWFRSDKNGVNSTAIESEMARQIGDAYTSIQAATAGYASVLGINADGIANRSQTMSITLTKDAAESEKLINDYFGKLASTMAKELLPSLSEFTRQGEEASATLQRLVNDYQAVDSVLATLGKTGALGSGVDSIGKREQLANAAGGAAQLTSGTVFFAQNFMTSAKQMESILASVDRQMSAIGAAGIKTTTQFYEWVNGMDLATQAGAKQYAQALAVAPQFKQAIDYLDGVAGAKQGMQMAVLEALGDAHGVLAIKRQQELDVLMKTTPALLSMQQALYAFQDASAAANSEMAVLSKSVAKEKNGAKAALNAQLAIIAAQKSAAKQSLDVNKAQYKAEIDAKTNDSKRYSALASSLQQALQSMRLTANSVADRKAAQGKISTALATAKSGGVVNADGLSDALKTAAQQNQGDFASYVDFARDYGRTAGEIADLKTITDDQLLLSDQQLALAKEALANAELQASLQADAYEFAKTSAQEAYERQVAQYDAAMQLAQDQLDVATGTYVATKSVGDAMASLSASINAVVAQRAVATQQVQVQPSPQAMSTVALESKISDLQGQLTKALKPLEAIAASSNKTANVLNDVSQGGTRFRMEAQ